MLGSYAGEAMKALTLHQPHASLVALLVKSIETRSWATKYRGPLAIHAGRSESALHYPGWLEEHQGEAEPALMPFADRITMTHAHRHGVLKAVHDLPLGAIVATAPLVDVVPIVNVGEEQAVRRIEVGFSAGEPNLMLCDPHPDGEPGVDFDASDFYVADVTSQLPYGDFTPGRFAWLLEDIKPTTERCPACGGTGWLKGARLEGTNEPVPCPTCDGDGKCDPVPARGRQGLWTWAP